MSIDHTGSSEITNKLALEMPGERMRHLTIGWLSLALGSLVVGGLLTVVIVLSRTPYIQDIFPWVDLFHTALVVHVDLTVLVWPVLSGVLTVKAAASDVAGYHCCCALQAQSSSPCRHFWDQAAH